MDRSWTRFPLPEPTCPFSRGRGLSRPKCRVGGNPLVLSFGGERCPFLLLAEQIPFWPGTNHTPPLRWASIFPTYASQAGPPFVEVGATLPSAIPSRDGKRLSEYIFTDRLSGLGCAGSMKSSLAANFNATTEHAAGHWFEWIFRLCPGSNYWRRIR